ncbi:uncharacterized protein LOC133823592 [Humulus lupulus]|uniref:uncharacterized protein LOC133823592 n=1 Tax=Humulus lupulus TaxID=3486 RepID=UPI002B4174EF|nr:uncharacterized protein LOC133823592 [Humulus lupulus]
MAIDKSWTKLRNRACDVYWDGLQNFINMASQHKDCDGRIRCPCVRCMNLRLQTLDVVQAHIFDRGFQQSYEQWIYYGEVEEDVDDEGMDENEPVDEMRDVVDDFLLPNNAEEANSGMGQYYDELFDEIEAELYSGCDWISSLNFLAKLMHLKVRGKIPNNTFDELLKYDCCLFFNEHASKDSCPVCESSRWINEKNKGKKVPHKVMRYFPLIPRLKRLYSSRYTVEEMLWHHTGRSKEEGMMRHPVDGLAWKDFDARHPDFARDPRNVRLGLAADGFNPFGNMSLSYSMWPVVLTNYNLPPWLCMKDHYFMLTLLIPGPKSPGKDIDVFLRPLVEELKELWINGVETRDGRNNSMFKMRAALLWTVNDFPARSSLFGWSGQGYKACPTCNEDTSSIRVIGKTYYVGHRRFLTSNHRWRKDTQFDGKVERRCPPRKFTCQDILDQVTALPPQVPGKHERFGGLKRKRGAEDSNWRKKSIFYELDYWSTNELKHNIDVMHVEKNVCDSVLGTILDNDKSKDTTNARHDLKNMGVRDALWIYEDQNKKLMKPHAPYVLTPEDRREFLQFLKGVKLPDGFCSNLKKKVTDNDSNIIGQLCSRTLNVNDMEKAQREVIHILCKMELIFPPAFFDIMIHLVLHLPEEALLGGPVFMRWMYPFERYMKKLKNYVRNKARPEGSIAEGYVADEALTFCSMYFKGVETKFNCLDRNVDIVYVPRHLSVFQSQCRPLSKGLQVSLDEKTRNIAEWFILENSSEIEVYMDEHLREIKQRDPLGDHNLLHKKEFRSWFHEKIYDLHQLGSLENGDELLALASGGRAWKVVEEVNHRQVWDIPSSSNQITDNDVVHDTNSSNFILTVELGELAVQQSNQPATFIGNIARPYSTAQETDDFINDDEEVEDVEEADDEDDLLVDLSEDENTNPVSPLDVDLLSDDSDYCT